MLLLVLVSLSAMAVAPESPIETSSSMEIPQPSSSSPPSLLEKAIEPPPLEYVAQGAEFEVFGAEKIKTVSIVMNRVGSNRLISEKLNHLIKDLQQNSAQKVVRYNSRPDDSLTKKAQEISSLYSESLEETQILERLLSTISNNFSGGDRISVSPCNLTLPLPKILEILEHQINAILATDSTVAQANLAFVEVAEGGELATKDDGSENRPGTATSGLALLALEISLSQIIRRMRNLNFDIRTFSDRAEMMLNHKVPAGVLTGLEALSDCVQKGTQDMAMVKGCLQNRNQVACKLEILQKGEGTEAHRLVPLPYFANGTTLRLDFPGNLVFRMPGLTMDISTCENRQGFLKCPDANFKANDCLEKVLAGGIISLPNSCKVVTVPPSPPLVVPVKRGNLVAQRSKEAMVVEYQGQPITRDPFIVANSKPLEITVGSEKIIVPPFSGNTDDVLLLPEGNFDLLKAALDDIPWREYWESVLPLDFRQILLIAVATAQAITMWPSVIKIVDCLVSCCGLVPRPHGERTYYRRYQIRSTSHGARDVEAQEMDPLQEPDSRPITPRSVMSVNSRYSGASSTSTERYRNQRALDRHLEHHSC